MALPLQEALRSQNSEAQDSSAPLTSKRRVRLFAIAGVVAIVVIVVVVVILLTSKGGGKLSCSIDNCNRASVPDGAADCSEAVCESCDEGFQVGKDSMGSYCSLDCSSQLAYCAQAKSLQRGDSTCEKAGCQKCTDNAETALDDQTLLPTDKCRFVCTQNQITNGCAPGSCTDEKTCSLCVPGFVQSGAAGKPCTKAASAAPMTFFMYRAQSDTVYPPENVDLASAAGVMWYIHNEVVNVGCQCPPGETACTEKQRHYDITLVLRYKVTVYNTPEVYGERQGQFGHFYTFDKGQCTNADCEKFWTQYGFTVGCQQLVPAQHSNYPLGAWYSLPGHCPSLQYSDPHKSDCNSQVQPGGHCDQPTGNSTCTWTAQLIDNVTLNDFCGITDYQAFCAAGKKEYDQLSDKGVGCSFWDDKNNATRNKERVLRLEQLFARKNPGQHSYSVPDPVCDGF